MNDELLTTWEQEIAADPTRIRSRFPAAAREIGRSGTPGATPGEVRVEDAVRVRLLAALAGALADDPDGLAAEVHDLYRFGDADERRAVLLGLGELGLGAKSVSVADLVHDALRTNDVRLVAAALSPAGAALLDDTAWRQAVLKCLFVGVPLELVGGLDERTDDTLVTMVAAYADERTAADRDVPEDARRLLATAPSSSPRES